MFLADEEPSIEQLKAAVRRATIKLTFVPVMMGSALKNRGVQTLLDGVVSYLPNPTQVRNFALDASGTGGVKEVKREVFNDSSLPLLALAFKLDDGKYGQLTFLRIYQGCLRKGDYVFNTKSGKKVKVPRVVRLHANQIEDVNEIKAGEICAIFGVDCSAGDTFTDGKQGKLSMESMFVPEAVVSLSIQPKARDSLDAFSKGLARFQKEDPTFRVAFDEEAKQTVISGMGELHLFIYAERLRREFGVETITGAPYVRYREAITERAEFDFTHKKQSGGSGQWGRVIGYIEPLEEGSTEKFVFKNEMIGNAIPQVFIASVQKGFDEAAERGNMTGHPIQGVRVVLTDGQSHPVDSNDIAFRMAAIGGFRQAFEKAGPCVLEPIMRVEVQVPAEFQGVVISGINQRKGQIVNSEATADNTVIEADVPLKEMFGFVTFLRSNTQGKGEFSMEYVRHSPAPRQVMEDLKKEWIKKKGQKE